jgi:ribosome recycling factor
LTDTFWHRTYCVEANRQRTSNFRSVQVNAAVLDNVDVETSHSAVPTADRDDSDN